MESRRYSKERFAAKTFHRYENPTVSDSILLLVEKLYLDVPYNKIFPRSSSQWFNRVYIYIYNGGFQKVSFFDQKAKGNGRVTSSFSFGITKA